jgi:hypothetical protein
MLHCHEHRDRRLERCLRLAEPVSRVAVVTPIFEDRVAAAQLFRELRHVLGDDVVVVAVDDGSVREPMRHEHLADSGVAGVILTLHRNVGHQRAIAAGLGFIADTLTEPEYVVVMDSDGEDVPACIPDLLAQFDSPSVDIVVAARRRRVSSVQFLLFYRAYRLMFRALTGRTMSFGNFMAMRPDAARRLAVAPQTGRHLAASALVSGLGIAFCSLDRGPRYAGTTKMNFRALARHALSSLSVFTHVVLARLGIACAVVATFAAGGLAVATGTLVAAGLTVMLWPPNRPRTIGGQPADLGGADHRTSIARELHVDRADQR